MIRGSAVTEQVTETRMAPSTKSEKVQENSHNWIHAFTCLQIKMAVVLLLRM